MKSTKNSLIGTTLVIFTCLCTIVRPLNAMEQELEHVWVATSDSQKFTMPQWQIDQIKVLQRLFSQLQGPSSYHNAIDAPATEADLSLIRQALDVIKKSERDFYKFYNTLKYREQSQLSYAASQLGAVEITSLVRKDFNAFFGNYY